MSNIKLKDKLTIPLSINNKNVITFSQKSVLIEYIKKNPDLVTAKHSNKQTKETMQKKWQEISSILNAIAGGAQKSAEQWKRSWQDQRAAIKKKKRCNVQSLNKTGGGPLETIDINDDEMSVIVPTVTVFGDKNIHESIAKFDDDSIEDDELKDVINDGIHEDTYVIDNTKENYDVIDDINKIIDVDNDSSIIEFKNESISLPNELKSFETSAGPSDIKKNPDIDLVSSPKSTKNIKNDYLTDSQVSTSKHPRALAVQCQKYALKNSENMIEVSKKEVNVREKFYHQKLYFLAKSTRLKNIQSRALHSLTNKLISPW